AEQPAGTELRATPWAGRRRERVLVSGGELDVDARVILQVLADLTSLRDDLDAVRSQLVGVADTGEHQQPRRVHGPGGDNHLAPGSDALRNASTNSLDPDGRSVLHHDPAYRRALQDVKIPSVGCRPQKGAGGAPPDPIVDGRLGDVH